MEKINLNSLTMEKLLKISKGAGLNPKQTSKLIGDWEKKDYPGRMYSGTNYDVEFFRADDVEQIEEIEEIEEDDSSSGE